MSDYIDVNTTSDYPTHFLRGVDLIEQARDKFNIPSENWPYPTRYRFGIPGDKYYSEIWVDGMDWQKSFWVIETFNYNDPICRPFIVFEDHENFDRFNSCDFSNLIKAALYGRRDILWIQKNDDIFNDIIWTYFKVVEPRDKMDEIPEMVMFQVEHASQPRVEFYMNTDFVPKRKFL